MSPKDSLAQVGARTVGSAAVDRDGHVLGAEYARGLAELASCLDAGAPTEEIEGRSLRLAALARQVDPAIVSDAAAQRADTSGAWTLAPLRLEVVAEPPQPEGRVRRWTFEPQLRPRILVIADATGRNDARAFEGRVPVTIALDAFDRRFRDQRLRFTVERGGRSVTVELEDPSELESAVLAAKLAASDGLGGGELDAIVGDVLRHPPLIAAERTWRSLRLLAEAAGPEVPIDLVSCTKEDLAFTFEDAPDPRRSGVSIALNAYDHHGMAPYSLVVVDHAIDPSSEGDQLLARELAAVGRSALVPVVANLAAGAPPHDEVARRLPWRDARDGDYLALAGPSFVLRRAAHGTLLGGGAVLAGMLAADRFRRHLWGGPLLGSIPAVNVEPAAAPARGHVGFAPTAWGASLVSDATLGSAPERLGSLSAALLVTRMAHQVLDIDCRDRGSWSDRDLGRMQDRFDTRLAARLAALPGVSVTTSDLRWCDDDRFLEATVTVTWPSPTSAAGTTLRQHLSLRLDR